MLHQRKPLDQPEQKILLIDSEPALLALLQELLEGEGYAVFACSQVRQALEWVEATKPDLIILDPWQGSASAWGVVAQLAADPMVGNVPCIFYSVDHKGLKEHESELGTRGWVVLPKPFDLEALVEVVSGLIGAGRALESKELIPA